MVFVIS